MAIGEERVGGRLVSGGGGMLMWFYDGGCFKRAAFVEGCFKTHGFCTWP